MLTVLLGGGGPRARGTVWCRVPGRMPAVVGAGWGCFPLCLLSRGDGQWCGSRPASPGQPIVGQLRGEGEGQPPRGFPNRGGGHHASAAQPEMAPVSAHPSVRLGDTGGDPGLPAGTLAPSTPQLPPCLPQPLVELGDPGAGVMAASVLSTGMSFCAPPAESFSLAGHEKAFIPSPPRGRITPGRTLCCRLTLGLPVTPVRVGAWHSPAGAFCGDPEQTAASVGPHEPYLLLSRLWTNRCPLGRGGTWLWLRLCFQPSYLYL